MAFRSIIMVLIVWPVVAFCNPSETVNKIRSEPASMYDLGLYRLEKYIESNWIDGELGVYTTSVFSDFMNEYSGEIIIKLYFKSGVFQNEKEKCEEIIKTFREREVFSTYDYSSNITGFFMHNQFVRRGYDMNSSGERDLEFAKSVINLFTIVAIQKDSKQTCFGPYNGTSVTFK